MKKKHMLLALVIVFSAAVIFAVGTAFAGSDPFRTGVIFRDASAKPESASASRDDIAATYKEQAITWAEVQYARDTAPMHSGDYPTDDRSIVDRLIRGKILVELAEERGAAATDDEIQELIENQKIAYSIPDGKAIIDEYCAGLGIDFDGYLDILSAQAYDTISMQKMRNLITQDICARYGVEYSTGNLPQYVNEAVADYLDSLVSRYRKYVKYYF